MGEIVNLRLCRKRALREKAASLAADKRGQTGRTKKERQAGLAEAAKLEAHLDGHRLERRTDEQH